MIIKLQTTLYFYGLKFYAVKAKGFFIADNFVRKFSTP